MKLLLGGGCGLRRSFGMATGVTVVHVPRRDAGPSRCAVVPCATGIEGPRLESMSRCSGLDIRWDDTVMGGARAQAVVRALAETAYSRVVPDMSRPAWFAPELGGVDDLPARMRLLKKLLGRPGSLLWGSPPRPKPGNTLSAAQQDLQWAVSEIVPIFCQNFSGDPIAMQALAATVMAWGAAMPLVLRYAAHQAAIDELLAGEQSKARKFYMEELAFLIAAYVEGQMAVVSGENFSKVLQLRPERRSRSRH